MNSVHLFPKNTDHIIVCNETSSIYIMTLQGQVLILNRSIERFSPMYSNTGNCTDFFYFK